MNQNGATTIFVGLFMFFINNIQHIVPLRKFRDFLHFLSPVFLSFSLPYSVPTYPLPLFIRSLCTGGGEMLFPFFVYISPQPSLRVRNVRVIARRGIRKEIKIYWEFFELKIHPRCRRRVEQ